MCDRLSAEAGPSRVGRPRDPSVEQRVLQAARDELAEIGVDGFSIRSVARRAGVARPSVALRWPDVDALIVDALDDIHEFPGPDPDGTLRDNILELLDALADTLGSPLIELQMRLVADGRRHPELLARFHRKVMRAAAERFQTVLHRAVERGALPPDVDRELLADSLIGVLLVRTISSPQRRPPAGSARRVLVDQVLANLGVHP